MQSINLEVKKNYLPVNLTDEESGEVVETLRFYYDDESVKNFEKHSGKVMKKIEKIEKSNKPQSVVEDQILQEWFDYTLGPGAYEKIKQVQKSIYHRKEMLVDLSLALSNALYLMREQQEEKLAESYQIEK